VRYAALAIGALAMMALALVSSACDKAPVTITVQNNSDAEVRLIVDDETYVTRIAAGELGGMTLDVNYKPKRIVIESTSSEQPRRVVWEFDEETDDFDNLEIVFE
jgi:hypothetical protein